MEKSAACTRCRLLAAERQSAEKMAEKIEEENVCVNVLMCVLVCVCQLRGVNNVIKGDGSQIICFLTICEAPGR